MGRRWTSTVETADRDSLDTPQFHLFCHWLICCPCVFMRVGERESPLCDVFVWIHATCFSLFFKQWTSRIRKAPCSPSLPDLHLSPSFPASPSRLLLPSIRCHWFRWSGWWATDSRWATTIKRIQSKLTPEVFYTNPECQRPCITYILSGHYSPQQLGHWCFISVLLASSVMSPRVGFSNIYAFQTQGGGC